MRYSVYCKDRRVSHTRHGANQTKPFEDQGGRTACFVRNKSAFSIEAGPSHALSQKSCDGVAAFGYGQTLDIFNYAHALHTFYHVDISCT
jgi:hypothetical protein